jgi:hypothetical protein
VAISNITMTDVRCAVFVRLGNRGRDMKKPEPGTIKNVTITNLVAGNAQWPCTITGIPGHPVEGVTLSDFRLGIQGGGTRELRHREVPEHIAKYPSAEMFGILPASALYCRHARDIRLSHIHIQPVIPDARDTFVCEDVTSLDIDSIK